MTWLDAMFGVLSDNGTELELLGGLNFIGFTIVADPENNRHNITATGGGGGGGGGSTVASGITNDSSVIGATVKDALNTLLSTANTNATNISTNGTKITALTVAGAGKLPYVSGTPGTYSASVWTTDGTNLSGVGTIACGAVTSTGVGTFVGIVAGGAVSGVTTLAMTGALTGATAITAGVLNVGGGTIGTGGDINLDAAADVYGKNTGAGSSRLLGWGGADLSLGDNTWAGTQTIYLDCGATGFHVLRHNGTNHFATSVAGTVFSNGGGVLTGVVSINAASVVAPVQGTAVTTTVTLQIGNGSEYDVTAAGGAYAITLGTTGVADGDMFILRATNALANAVTITNGGTGGGNLGPSGVMTSAVKATYYYYYDGTATAWKYSGRVRCA
jgi:hypothetical protein